MPVDTDIPIASGNERLQVGECIVEPALNQVSSASGAFKVEPKAMLVLVYLAGRAGRVVSRDELLSAAWPGVVVGDDSLTQVVLKLRKALGDTAEKPAYIQTIPKGGYRLVAPVKRGEEIASLPVTARSRPLPVARTQRVRWVAGAGIALSMLAVLGFWRLDGERISDASPTRAPTSNTEANRAAQPAVAIRSFEPLGDDPQATLLAQGMTADLLTDLSKVAGLSVIAIAPLRSYPEGEPPASAAPIRYFVSGSVQRVDERLRLQVHLTDALTGRQLWSERYDRSLSSFFAIQEEVGTRILQTLPSKVSEAELRRVAQRYTRNLEAYEYFQRGQSSLLVRERADNETARELFRHAIALDPGFARAYAGVALTYAADYRNGWTDASYATLERALEMARTAYQMDPDSAETYWVLAFVNVERRQHDEALQQLATAVRLYPSFADGYALMGGIHTYLGRPAETVPLLRTAMRLDPQAGSLYFLLLGRAYFFLGDLELAGVNLRYALARNPASLEAHVYMAAVQVAAGDQAAAAWEAEEIRALQPDFSAREWLATYPMTDAAQKDRLVHVLRELSF